MTSKLLFETKNLGLFRKKWILRNVSWQVNRGEHWAVIGHNGSGKSSLLKVLKGSLYYSEGSLQKCENLHHQTKLLSFDTQLQLLQKTMIDDQAKAFSESFQDIQVNDVLQKESTCKLVEKFAIHHLLQQPITALSNGETRKVLIVKALFNSPKLVILDEPFEGLDTSSQKDFAKWLEGMVHTTTFILASHRFDDIPAFLTHALCLKQGQVYDQGNRDKILQKTRIAEFYGEPQQVASLDIPKPLQHIDKSTLVEMINVNVSYGQKSILKDFNWRVSSGDQWQIIGANGTGKSTLVKLIYGSCLQVHSNEVYLFGKRRGKGESLEELRSSIGLLSPELHLTYDAHVPTQTSIYAVILSGFFDSIGLYQTPNNKQQEIANQWLEVFQLLDWKKERFSQLSYGQKMLCLLVRALVKSPKLLILDEPCQGMDYATRTQVLQKIDLAIATFSLTTLYITHNREDQLQSTNQYLHLTKSNTKTFGDSHHLN